MVSSPDFGSDVEEADLETRLYAALDEQARLRRELGTTQGRFRTLSAEKDRIEQELAILTGVRGLNPRPPRWLAPAKPQKGHHGTLAVLLSDTHFDEVVEPSEMGGINAYHREIAELRLKRWAERVVMLARDYTQGVKLDGLCVFYGGDILSGDIHEELRRTNEDTLLGGVLHWQEQLAAALGLLAEEFGKVHVAATFGNHGRLTEKQQTKLEARQNLDWLLARQLQNQFKSNENITFDVPEARDTYVTIYETTHCLNHGNETTGGSGIGGIWPPIMRMKARKAERDLSLGRSWDVLVIGHWHQEIFAPQQGLIVNPSMKGYDQFAARHNFRPERPAQLAWLVTPEHGITDGRPIIVGDRSQEGW